LGLNFRVREKMFKKRANLPISPEFIH
jgi:hypothetical protein